MPNRINKNRLEAGSGEIIDRNNTVEFYFDGRRVSAHEGDTVASALYASGVSTYSRGFKYHRPRGLLCAAGRCPNCLVNVDGVPNVRACTQAVRPDMRVRHQNSWPSLNIDFLSILDRLGWLMPVGFYYKAMHQPKLLWRVAQRVIRQVGGLGRIDIRDIPETDYHHQHHNTDLAVIGGGPAGMSAALAAADNGTQVTLVDDQPNLGGHLRFSNYRSSSLPEFGEASTTEVGDQLAGRVQKSSNIQVKSGATVFSYYQDNLLGILHGNELLKLRAKQVVLATGSYEVPLVFRNNDLPGIMLATAAQRLIRLYGVKPGNRAVVATCNDDGYQVALDLLDAGVEVAAVIDSRQNLPQDLEAAGSLGSRNIPILHSRGITKAEGKTKVRGVTVATMAEGEPTGEVMRFRCDLVCISGGFQPANALLYQSGGTLEYDEALSEAVPKDLPASLYVAGEVTGIHDLAASLLQGKLAGLEAVSKLGSKAASLQAECVDLRQQLANLMAAYADRNTGSKTQPEAAVGKKNFVCFCEDITTKDISDAIAEGFEDIQILKRYSTVTMGPCQGKMCLKSFVGLCAQYTGKTIDSTASPRRVLPSIRCP